MYCERDMSNNKEKQELKDSVHLYLALQREGTAKDKKCIRQVIKDEALDLRILEAKCKVLGGKWRIHKTVNARDCEKARIILLKMLIDHPEKASVIDSEWRTVLMQRECRTTDLFMLDIDTQEPEKLEKINKLWVDGFITIRYTTKTPKGYHYICEPFDTRLLSNFDFITVLRDGYYFIEEILWEGTINTFI